MSNKIIKGILAGVIMSLILTALPMAAYAAGTPHTSWGIVSGGQNGDSWTFYAVARPTETLTGALDESAGTYYWRALAGNLTTPWAGGDDSMSFIARETNPGANNHTGYYVVMNEDLSVSANPQQYNDCTMRQIPTPVAAQGSGVVNLSWSAAQTDPAENDHGNNIAGYNVYRSTSQASGFTQINSSLVTDTSYSDSSGTSGTTYYYTIEPVFRGGLALGVYSANSNGIEFPASSPVVTGIDPASGSQGQTLDVTINGENTSWNGDMTSQVHFSQSGVVIYSATASSATQITAHIAITSDAATGARTVTVDGATGSATFTISAGGTALDITTTSLPNGSVGAAYSQTLTATGGTTPYTWSISAGALPAGLTLSTAGVISGTPTGAETANFTVRVTDNVAATDTQDLSITIATGGGGSDFTVAPTSAYVGQTIVLNGSGFGADPGTVTVDGITANPTAWNDTSITLAVPSGATTGSIAVGAQSGSVTIISGGAVIDDVEGGSVGNFSGVSGLANSGYYVFDNGITPADTAINTEGPQTAAAAQGSRGMQIRYSYTTGWGGGWGGLLANTLDLNAYNTFSFYVLWDGSQNDFSITFQDSDGHVYACPVSNTSLSPNSTQFGLVTVNRSSFAEDTENGSRTPGAIDWTSIVSYNVVYKSTNASASYHYIDSFVAGTVDLGSVNGGGGGTVISGEVVVTNINPPAGPAGTKFTASGSGFGASQGQSIMVFENITTRITYPVEILSWSDTSIEATVPRLATAGNYELKVIRMAVAAGGDIQAYESNPAGFRITAMASATGTATVYPNPFNPLESTVPVSRASGMAANTTSIAYNATGVQNVGVYIYDTNARLVYHQVSTGNQITWDGRDMKGELVADGVYLLRVVNEDSKSLISKGKILIIKRN